MSCFVLPLDHFNAIVTYLNFHQIDKRNERIILRDLVAENYHSYHYRYNIDPRDPANTIPFEFYQYKPDPAFLWTGESDQQTHITMMKLIRCYQYQSCEHDGWLNSYAKQITDHAFTVALHKALPEYAQSKVWVYEKSKATSLA